ncbi:hypothetical protein PC9H_001654 [Pleurotus ostreatus]|uniref:Uncharacterized protein n=1 Tax=Pleurotus ostreatus TaxID=5322 RepID=A0A8H7DXZ8_PLEOS|nr:uncharacterized protein PC9H_001654 [Pleurotus ostreatus]KAF7441305.1 hypothetical protein PC9H_001654 [Pleurotus ostreatus]
MKYRQQKTAEVIAKLQRTGGELPKYDDFTSGREYLNAVQSGLIKDNDTVLMYSLDGCQLYRSKTSDCWIFVWIFMDLDGDFPYKKVHVSPGIVIVGPNKPQNLDSFLFPTFYHVAALQLEGLQIWDADLNATFISNLFLLFGIANGPGLALHNGLVGHKGRHGCRLHCPISWRILILFSLDSPSARNDYPNIKFWTRSQWTKTNSRFKSETKFELDPTGSDSKPRKRNNYIETADGDLLNKEDMAKIRLTMRGAFQQLKRLELAPDTWTKICHLGRKLYLLTICGVHPKLTYCDSFWKAEQIAIHHFPSWYNNHIRIKKPDIKKEQVDSKCPLPKRGNSTPTDGIPSKKARTESDIQNESQDDNTNKSIYYDPPASPTTTTKANLGNDALVINNPLYI